MKPSPSAQTQSARPLRGREAGGAGEGGPDSSPDRARVLVVDDDERNLLAIRMVIEDIADVVIARSGEEALRHLLKGDFAVILLDVYMPGMDGYETAQLIRQREQTKRIPIVFLSAVNKEAEHLIRGYSMGAVDYVFKPVEPIVLRSKVAVFVDLFTMTREIERKAQQEQLLLDATIRANAERLRAEQELRIAEQRQAAIIQSLPIVLYLENGADIPRLPRFVGGNFATVTGFDVGELHHSPNLWQDRLHPEDRDRVLSALRDRQPGAGFSVEYRWQCADGRYKHFLDQGAPLGPGGKREAEFAGTMLDITDRKDLEFKLAHAGKMDAIGQLTGGIAHDFNNLLAAMLGGIGLIERRITLNEQQASIVQMMRRAATQGSELVARLLSFARRQTLVPAPVALDQLAAAIGTLLDHTLGGLVQLEWVIDEQVGNVYADASQLELALMNLIINARDAMPDGGVVRLSAENRLASDAVNLGLAPGDYVVLTVADRGHGIPSDQLDQVLEPFFTTKEVGKGTGLGLSMVYGFVKQSGGNLRIESEVGAGTRVEIWLPAINGEPQGAEASEPGAAPLDRDTEMTLRILLVDDHEGVRATTAALLEDLGHIVTEAADGHAALRVLAQSPGAFDLIISDYAMPHISGVELLRRVRDTYGPLPGLIITGYAEKQIGPESASNAEVLKKPFTPGELKSAVRAALKRGESASAGAEPSTSPALGAPPQ